MRGAKGTRSRILLAVVVTSGLCVQWFSTSSIAAAQGSQLPAGAQYAALGSSYAAGYGIKPLTPNAGACGRSLVDYPHLVAAALHLQLDDVSCGGAVIGNVLTRPQGAAPPQIDAVTAATRLVTMTVGGNDVNYVGTAIACGQPHSTCVTSASGAATNAAFQVLPRALNRLIRVVRTRAPSALIVLVTYVRIVPPTSCATLNYTPAARSLVASMGQRLERVFVSVARENKVILVDPYALGATHGPCARGNNRWVAGLVPTNGFEYHPTAAGHRAMARMVEQALARSS
jgi:lysophospholipase L1-like esterase